MIKVSICIPVYEQPENLDKCLNSIFEQSYKDFEVIITDDSKSNDLVKIVNNYKEKLNIIYFKNSPTKGSPENWNESLKYAKGKYIKILHHDDYFTSKDSLKMFVELLENNNDAKIAFCSSRHIDSKGKYLSSHILSDNAMSQIKINPKTLFFGNLIGAPSVMIYHRDLDLTYDIRMKWFVDIDFYIRLLNDSTFVYTKKELISINIGEEERVTYICENNKIINIYETMIMFEKFNLDFLTIRYKWHFIKLFSKYNIRNSMDIIDCGYDSVIHNDIKGLYRYINLFSRLYVFIKKIKNAIK